MAISAASGAPTHQQLKAKPHLLFWLMFTISLGFFGIQFGFALQNVNTSRSLHLFWADVNRLPMFLIVAPLVGMIVKPIVRDYSDKSGKRLGRRKPYFIIWALLSSIALIFLINSGSMLSQT